jgi:hypothetical protein
MIKRLCEFWFELIFPFLNTAQGVDIISKSKG